MLQTISIPTMRFYFLAALASLVFIFFIAEKHICKPPIGCADPEKNKTKIITAGHEKAPTAPAELTLEYMAVQLPRSYSFQ